jgi:hypothetical protein
VLRKLIFLTSLFVLAASGSFVLITPASAAVPGVSPSPLTGGWLGSAGSSPQKVDAITAGPGNGDVVVTVSIAPNESGPIIFALGAGQQLTTGIAYTAAMGDGIDMGTCRNAWFVFDALGPRNTQGKYTEFGVRFSATCGGSAQSGALAVNLPADVGQGYYMYQSNGRVSGFGNDSYLSYLGSLATTQLNGPVLDMAVTPDGGGYWMVGSDGGIFAFGDAQFYGSTGAMTLNKPIVGMTPTADGKGYWLVASDGGIFAFGDARFYGSMGGQPLNKPIVGIAATPDGGGYWEVASDGGIFAFGDAAFYGSTGAMTLNKPIVGIATTANGKGYWLVASDGGIFAYGNAAFYGSTGSMTLNKPIVGLVPTVDDEGYWFVASDGGVFAYGDAPFYGSFESTGTPTAPSIAGLVES